MPEPKSGVEIDALLKGEVFSYQKIELPHGRSVGVRDRSSTASAIFPEDLTGKSVLDIGCNYGYFCFEAKKRGASRVLGTDVDIDGLRRARLLADCLGLDVEFALHDVEKQPFTETFDYVLCLNVLHHLSNPLGVLGRLSDLAKERLVLEVATLGPHDGKILRLSFLSRFFLNRFPIIYVPPAEIEPNRSVKNYYLTPKAMEHLLLWQRRVFASVRSFRSDYKERFLTIAERRKVGHMLVLAGPTASGKRTTAKRLASGEIPELADILGVADNPSTFGEPMRDKAFRQGGPAATDRMIVRYDLLRPRFTFLHGIERDPVLDVLKTAQRATFVTIFAPPDKLREQLLSADRGKLSKRHKRMYEHYKRAVGLEEDYQRWFDYTERFEGDHYVILPYGGMRLMPASEFRRQLPQLLGLEDRTNAELQKPA